MTQQQLNKIRELLKSVFLDINRGFYMSAKFDTQRALAVIDEIKLPEEVTVQQISKHIEWWRFDDDIKGSFGDHLAKNYPHGFVITAKASVGD